MGQGIASENDVYKSYRLSTKGAQQREAGDSTNRALNTPQIWLNHW